MALLERSDFLRRQKVHTGGRTAVPGVAELHGVHEERHRGDLGNIFQLVLRGYNDQGHTDTHTHTRALRIRTFVSVIFRV